jgi:hypothetical protein
MLLFNVYGLWCMVGVYGVSVPVCKILGEGYWVIGVISVMVSAESTREHMPPQTITDNFVLSY